MPIVLRVRVVVDPDRRAKGQSAIGAARKHYVSCAAAVREYAGQHVDVVVSGRPGTVHCNERLPAKSYSIYAALNEVAAQVDQGDLVKGWRLVPVLRIARADAVKRAPSSGDKEIAIGVNVQRSVIDGVRNINWSHPCEPAIGGASELSSVASEEAGPELVLEPITHAAGRIDGEPLLVASMPWAALRPGLAAVYRVPYIVAEKRLSLV